MAKEYASRVRATGRCQTCGRSVGTFQRSEENQLRACTHKSNQGAGTFANPTRFSECPGSSQTVVAS